MIVPLKIVLIAVILLSMSTILFIIFNYGNILKVWFSEVLF